MVNTKQVIAAIAILLAVDILGFSPALSFATGSSNTIAASLSVPNTCVPEVSNTAISFPSTQPGGFANTANVVTVTNFGNAASNVLVSGTSWVAGANSFGVTNTLWSATSGANIGTQLTGSAVDTKIVAAAGASNSIYFGANVPVSQAAGTYSQTITISTSC